MGFRPIRYRYNTIIDRTCDGCVKQKSGMDGEHTLDPIDTLYFTPYIYSTGTSNVRPAIRPIWYVHNLCPTDIRFPEVYRSSPPRG